MLIAYKKNFVFIKANFLKIIPNFLTENRKFDLAYIDGGKHCKITIFQMVNIWEMLPIGGIIFVDHYSWRKESSNAFSKIYGKFLEKLDCYTNFF